MSNSVRANQDIPCAAKRAYLSHRQALDGGQGGHLDPSKNISKHVPVLRLSRTTFDACLCSKTCLARNLVPTSCSFLLTANMHMQVCHSSKKKSQPYIPAGGHDKDCCNFLSGRTGCLPRATAAGDFIIKDNTARLVPATTARSTTERQRRRRGRGERGEKRRSSRQKYQR